MLSAAFWNEIHQDLLQLLWIPLERRIGRRIQFSLIAERSSLGRNKSATS
jgi:hypothetical protein